MTTTPDDEDMVPHAEAAAFCAARMDAIKDALRKALTDDAGLIRSPFVLLLPAVAPDGTEGSMWLSNMQDDDALNVMQATVTQRVLRKLNEAIGEGTARVVAVIPLGEDDDDNEPHKVH